MNYPKIAAAELLETHGDRLFLYCWSMLRSRETAQTALRDTLLAAPAGATGSRLYSLARAACGQHRAVPAADADEAPVCLGRNDADNRLVAWNAAMSLEPAEFEALELGTRHEVDLGQVLGLPAGEAQALLTRATLNLERAVGAEVLARRGHPCPDRAEVLAGWSGTMTPRLRDRVLEHAFGCEACTEARPRNVSATRVFSLLPTSRPAPRPTARPAGTRSRRGRRTSLVIAGVGAVASAVVITSAFALAGSSRPPVAVREVTPVAAGTSTGTAPQTSGPGTANPGRVSSGNEAARLSRTQLGTPPPLVSTAGGRNRVLFTAATQPLSPARAPATTRNSAAGQPPAPPRARRRVPCSCPRAASMSAPGRPGRSP